MVDLSVDPEETPRQKHLKRLNAEAAERKKNKKGPVKVEFEMVYDTRGKPKYRRVFFMPNGNKYRLPVDKAEVETLKAQNKIR